MSRSSRSVPGGVAKVDSQCQKVRSPSVTGFSVTRRDVALQRHGRLDDAVGALVLGVRQRQQLLADAVAVLQREAAHAADLVAALVAFDAARVDDVVPLVVAVEVAQHRPDALDRRVDDGRADDAAAALRVSASRRSARFSASKPPWNTPSPIVSRQLALARLGAVELGAPFGEAARAVGHRRELERGDVVRRRPSGFRGSRRCSCSRSRTAPAAARGSCRRRACGSGGCSRPGRPARRSRSGCRRSPDATAAGR